MNRLILRLARSNRRKYKHSGYSFEERKCERGSYILRETVMAMMGRSLHNVTPWTVLILLTLADAAISQNMCRTDKNCRETFLMERLKTYDRRIAPNFNNDEQITVNTSIYVLSIDSVSEMGMEYWLSMYLRQSWVDERLAFKGLLNDTQLTLDAIIVGQLWVPDMFSSNEKSGYFHTVTKPNRLVRLSEDGGIFYSSRLTLKVSCPMALHNFPLDTQVCELSIESYGYSKELMNLQWSESIAPVEVDPNLMLPQYKLMKTKHEYCDKTYSTGTFSCMRLLFYLKRDIGFYMIQTYVPSILVVVLSWVSFWISPESVPARISLGVLCVLTMTTQSAGIRQTLPRVSYIKAIDVWMSVCLFFVFAALLEFAIVNVFSRREVRRPAEQEDKPETNSNGLDEAVVLEDSGAANPDNINVNVISYNYNKNKSSPEKKKKKKKMSKFMPDPKGKDRARYVDYISRKLFPGVFFVFNGVYWVIYILSSLRESEAATS